MPCNSRLNRLPNPPDCVGDKLHSAIGIELPRRGHQTHVAFPDQIHEGDPAVLKLLGHRHHEPDVVPSEALLGLHVALERTPSQSRLFLHRKQRNPADLLEVKIEALMSLVDRSGQGRRAGRPTACLLSACHVRCSHQLSPSLGGWIRRNLCYANIQCLQWVPCRKQAPMSAVVLSTLTYCLRRLPRRRVHV